ncbi:MAG: DUF6807 family protein [Planctomycetota bacterium]
MTVLCLPVAFANEPGFTDEPGTRVTVRNAQGIAVLTYEYAEVLGEDGKVSFDTAKVFYHVVGPDGEQMLTKGPGGRFPHHRGIYIGWNNLRHNGQRHDLWHVRNTQQKHQAFTRQETTDAGTTIASRIQWIGTDGAPVLEEVRTVTVHHETGDAYAVIDFTSELTAAYGDVQLSGDPEHAGIQFRASQEVAENKSATYVFPVDEPKDQQYTGMPWAALTFQVDGQKWTVQQMAYPGNPEGNARWSAYRDYGRFGQFPTYQIEEGQRITLQYRFRVTPGEAPDRAGLNEAYEAYAE